MMTYIRLCVVWLAIAASGANAALAHPTISDSLPNLVQEVRRSIVGIGTFQALRRPPIDLKGTGFVVHDGRYVATNYHVVSGGINVTNMERLVIIVGNGRNYSDRDAEVIAIDPDHDVAILKITGNALPPARLGTGGLMPDGTAIAVTGYPIGSVLGVYPVTHSGIISAITPIRIPQPDSRLLDAKMLLRNPFDVYQLDLTAFPGNSGSPVYDITSGRVVGILNSTFVKETKERALTNPTGISFAIPVVYIYQLLQKAGL